MARSVFFYDPHQDGEGCGEPKPYALTLALEDLDGDTLPIHVAVEHILDAAPDATVIDRGGYLAVALGPYVDGPIEGKRKFNYRAIRYRAIN